MNQEEYNESLFYKIKVLNETIWEGRVKRPNVEDWMQNFENEDEKNHALHLLSEFMYFGSTQMRQLLKGLYRDLYRYPIVESIRIDKNNTLDEVIIEKEFRLKESKTLFFGIGNPSESGAHLLYFFRQENKLTKLLFKNVDEIIDRKNPTDLVLRFKDVERYVFIDDFCGSGSQVSDDSTLKYLINELRSISKKGSHSIQISYLMLFATTQGIFNVRSSGLFDYVDSVIELDMSFKCFGSKSRYFPSNNNLVNLTIAYNMSKKYGIPLISDIISREYPLLQSHEIKSIAEPNSCGFRDCQLLIGFNHNTPDNTLPIIWYDEDGISWRPIFKRYNKKYGF